MNENLNDMNQANNMNNLSNTNTINNMENGNNQSVVQPNIQPNPTVQPVVEPTIPPVQPMIQPQEIQPQMSEMMNTEPPKKKKRMGRVIFNIITFILFIVIVLEAAIGVINMQRISNEEDPIWYLSTNKTETELKTVTEYNLGLYRIVKTDTARETKITLKPFFLKD